MAGYVLANPCFHEAAPSIALALSYSLTTVPTDNNTIQRLQLCCNQKAGNDYKRIRWLVLWIWGLTLPLNIRCWEQTKQLMDRCCGLHAQMIDFLEPLAVHCCKQECRTGWSQLACPRPQNGTHILQKSNKWSQEKCFANETDYGLKTNQSILPHSFSVYFAMDILFICLLDIYARLSSPF